MGRRQIVFTKFPFLLTVHYRIQASKKNLRYPLRKWNPRKARLLDLKLSTKITTLESGQKMWTTQTNQSTETAALQSADAMQFKNLLNFNIQLKLFKTFNIQYFLNFQYKHSHAIRVYHSCNLFIFILKNRWKKLYHTTMTDNQLQTC